ncbi:penicillin acylase family protein, partial [Candidatus Hodarchaeum mangrovi]
RLWVMDFYRRQAKGQLAEIFSVFIPEIIETDYSLRAMGFYRTAAEDWPFLTSETQEFFQAFADGINIFINNNKNRLPLEFGILNYQPDLWSPIDSIAILKLLGFGLTAHGGGEILIGQYYNEIENKSMLLEFAKMALDSTSIMWEDPVGYPSSNSTRMTLTDLNRLGWNPFTPGSNNWVIGGSRTTTGKPIIANDPHMSLETPSRWWFVDIKCPEFHVSGMTLPGLPAITLGRNEYLAWAFTNSQIDFLDTYIETFNSDYSQYLYNGSWKESTMIAELFYLNPKRTSFETREIILTTGEGTKGHGKRPVVPLFGINVSIRWVGHDSSSSAEALRLLTESTDNTSFVNALSYFNVPGQNVVFGDRLGNIGLYITGTIPIRKNGYGFAPHDGSIDTYEWEEEFVPFIENYHSFNPSVDYFVTANERFIPENYSYHLGWAFAHGYRASRIHEMINNKALLDYEYIMTIQSDVYSNWADEVLPFIISEPYSSNSSFSEIVSLLTNWDMSFSLDSRGAAVFAVWVEKFIFNVLYDQLPASLLNSLPLKGKLVVNILNSSDSSIWYDNEFTSEKTENKIDIITQTYEDTILFMQEKFGKKNDRWTWGNLHKVNFEHPMGLVINFFNAGGLHSSPGGLYTINVGTYNTKFIQHDGSSFRQIMGLDEAYSHYIIVPPGQSGHLGSKHYLDQIKNWIFGNYYQLKLIY